MHGRNYSRLHHCCHKIPPGIVVFCLPKEKTTRNPLLSCIHPTVENGIIVHFLLYESMHSFRVMVG